MKILALRDSNDITNQNLAYIIYYELEKRFYIEIADEVSKKQLPISLFIYMQDDKRSLNSLQSYEWLKQRIIPSERQNIVSILRDLHLNEYDEYRILTFNEGRCSQDDCYLVLINQDDLPDYIVNRFSNLIEYFIHLNDSKLLVFFKNGRIKRCDLKNIIKDDRFSSLINDYSRYEDLKLQAGGHGISFDDNLIIESSILYQKGFDLRITSNELYDVFKKLLISTNEACEILDCSRQNISDLVKRNKLIPFKQTNKDTLFLISDILQRIDK